MARTTTAKGKMVRRFGINIFGQPKFDKLLTKKSHGPGKSPRERRRVKLSDYGQQLMEKQKFRFCYGVSERQFRNIYSRAKGMGGITGNNMIELLERRFDNVLYRIGWTSTRAQARQLIGHKHLMVNGKSLNIPSALLRPGDTIQVKDRKAIKELIRGNIANANISTAPWTSSNPDALEGCFLAVPNSEDTQPAGKIQMVVEFYSRQ
ncbi:30S ribosomal protein S4 [Marispirochaeta aestuarii]|uniref:30S ribosomal protein S4 n=1 Tax=Marispirochaeta aestuarii TaxID=1963862 RepID=UPI002ABD2A40|nr:30S ribosomal protein S4 [Marispirochaeta aestuarii]